MDRTITIIASLCVCLGVGACDEDSGQKNASDKSAGAEDASDKGGKAAAKRDSPSKGEPKARAQAEPAVAATPEPTPEPEAEDAPAELVLEEVEVDGLGKIKLPKGSKSTAEKHYSYDLGNYERINVSWEPHGAPNLKKAEKLSKILANAEKVVSKKTLDSGFHEIERVRESDGFSLIAVFGPDWYVKCVAPPEKMDTCREIVRSKA